MSSSQQQNGKYFILMMSLRLCWGDFCPVKFELILVDCYNTDFQWYASFLFDALKMNAGKLQDQLLRR